jgi:hypothetical protein
VLENASFTFSSSAITVADNASSGTSDSITLTVLDGKLTLGATGGITILAGGNGTSSMTINATLANLNAALNGLVYTPRSGFTGTDTLSISVKDSNDNATSSASVSLVVKSKSVGGLVVVAGTYSMSSPTSTSTSTSSTPSAAADTQTTPTDEESTQWAGVSAAVEML